MATSLTIRNISVTPLELTQVERFEVHAVTTEYGVGHFFWDLFRVPYNYLSGCSPNDSGDGCGGLLLEERAAPTTRDTIRGVRVGAFETRRTQIQGPDPAREVLRLTFVAAFDGGASHRTYTVDVPAASPRSIELRPVNGGGSESAAAEAAAFTAVYTPTGAHLAIMSSAVLPTWMATVDGSWPLSSLSLPGTHNSPACHYALPSVRCQAVDVRAQLDNGVRFLDVRVSVNPPAQPHADPRLALVHSAFPVGLLGTHLFSELYDVVCGFLDAHPTETVLVSIKREGTGRGTDADLANQLLNHYTGRPDQNGSRSRRNDEQTGQAKQPGQPEPWRWYTEPRIPSLDEVRGRIVLIRRFHLPYNDDSFTQLHGGAGWGLDGSVWPDNCSDGVCGTGHMRLQDFYDVTHTANIETKIAYVRALLAKSAGENYSKLNAAVTTAAARAPLPLPPLFINFLTGSNFFNARCWPENIAAQVNPSVIEYLCVRHSETTEGPAGRAVGDGSTGIVVTDWVGHRGDWDLIRCIVAWNARLQLKQ